jgi:hypothetical protein
MNENYEQKRKKWMPKREGKRLLRSPRKIIKARYDAKSHYTAFDICLFQLDGKRARVRRCGTLLGANRKEIEKMLMRVAESFACRELHLERVGGPKAASTFVEIIGSNGQRHV